MANILTSLRQGITTRLIGSTNDFRTAITQSGYYKFYFHIAPQVIPGTSTSVVPPYCVWDLLPMNNNEDTVNKFYNVVMQFRVSSLAIGECENIMGYLTDRLEDCENYLTITSHSIVRITRHPLIAPSMIDNVWNGIVQYKIELQKV